MKERAKQSKRQESDVPTRGAPGDTGIGEPLQLMARKRRFETVLTWRGLPRPCVVGYDLYAWSVSSDGRKPDRLNEDMLPLHGEWLDFDPNAIWVPERDPLESFLKKPAVDAVERVPVGYMQAWVDVLNAGPNPPLPPRGKPKLPPRVEPGTYFLVDRYADNRQGRPTIMADRKWTPDLERERDELIRRALEEIRGRGLVDGLPEDPTLEELEEHIRGGVRGDRGELRTSEGRTFPDGPPDPDTGKTKSTLTLNGDAVLDADPEQLVALLLHELIHVAQNLDYTVLADLKSIAIDRINREVEAYNIIWEKIQNGDLNLRPGLQAREAFEGTQSIVNMYLKFTQVILQLEQAPTEAQKAAIREMRRRIRELLQRYQQFLATVPANALNALQTNGPNGQPMNAKELVDYLLQHTFN